MVLMDLIIYEKKKKKIGFYYFRNIFPFWRNKREYEEQDPVRKVSNPDPHHSGLQYT